MQELKIAIRQQALVARDRQPDKDALSRIICGTLTGLDEYHSARAVLWHVDVRSEVRTRPALAMALASGKMVAVPYCAGGELELFRLEAMEELAPGKYGILEPRAELRSAAREATVEEMDLVVVPGVAFGRDGTRLGHGLGYYDRLLGRARADAVLAGLAFECQMFEGIPMENHDMFLDLVVTEEAVHRSVVRKSARRTGQAGQTLAARKPSGR